MGLRHSNVFKLLIWKQNHDRVKETGVDYSDDYLDSQQGSSSGSGDGSFNDYGLDYFNQGSASGETNGPTEIQSETENEVTSTIKSESESELTTKLDIGIVSEEPTDAPDEQEAQTTENPLADGLLSFGKLEKEIPFDDGVKYNYCFDGFGFPERKGCNQDYAQLRCNEIREKYGCQRVKQGNVTKETI